MSVEDAIRRRLALAADRHRELSALSEDPEVAADHTRVAPILRELGRDVAADEAVGTRQPLLPLAPELHGGQNKNTTGMAEFEGRTWIYRNKEILNRSPVRPV